jgi:hypothetical protein
MPRLQILTTVEQKSFDKPPVLNSLQRREYFHFTNELLEMVLTIRKPSYKIGFLVACGYFRASQKFYLVSDFHTKDIEFVKRVLGESKEVFQSECYPNRTKQRHEHLILEYYGFERFNKNKERLLFLEIKKMVLDQLKPKYLFGRSIDYINKLKVETPSCYKLTELISNALNEHQNGLKAIILEMLKPEV